MTTITVVIPVLNDAAMLRTCLAALAAGTRLADEIVVVDNGSTDDSAEVARAAGARVIDEPHRGIMPATAAGFDAADGDIIARLDADSVPAPDWLERIEADFGARPTLSAVTGPGEFYGDRPGTHTLGRKLYVGGYFWFMTWMLGHSPLFGSNLALRAGTWRRVRGHVHRDSRHVHDDLDIAFHLQPGMTVLYDAELVVGISDRPFATFADFSRRIGMAFGTLGLHWREERPWQRRRARRAWEREHLLRPGTAVQGDLPAVTEDPETDYGWGSGTVG